MKDKEIRDCNGDFVRNGFMVHFFARLENNTVERLCGEVVSMYNDPYQVVCPLLCVALDDENCCIIPAEYVAVAAPSERTENENKIFKHPESFPAFPLKKY